MDIEVRRTFKGPKYTIGHMYLNGVYFCDTIEDVVRDLHSTEDKVMHETAIPAGRYRVVLSYSPRFKRLLPELKDVPFFVAIRIHSGNTEKDSSGCIIVGFNKVKGKVVDSRKTENRLMDILTKLPKDEEIWITVA